MQGGKAPWTYEESLAWLYGRQSLGIKLGLAKVEHLLSRLGNPHHRFQSIHVAGTNGKGSVTRMLAEVLRRAGHRTAATTSPHLVTFTERIEVDGREIHPHEVANLLHRIRAHVEAMDAQGEHATFFEVVTALAFLHFEASGTEWAVVETGLGGRLDATNVLRPALTIITNVDLDHAPQLGDTVAEIAWEKAGIMKPGVPCVTAARGEALLVIKAQSHVLQVPMSIIGEDYHVVRHSPDEPRPPSRDDSPPGTTPQAPPGTMPVAPDATKPTLALLRPTGESHYDLALAGAHQQENAAVVVAAVEALRLQGVQVPHTALQEGLRTVRNPGRLHHFEVPARQLMRPRQEDASLPVPPPASHPSAATAAIEILVDGAHNPAGAYALRNHLRERGWTGFDLLVGFCADKAWEEMLEQWAPAARRVWAVPVRSARSLDPAHIVEAVTPLAVPVEALPDARTAFQAASANGAKRILVAGSLFLAGEAIAVLSGRSLEEIRGNQ